MRDTCAHETCSTRLHSATNNHMRRHASANAHMKSHTPACMVARMRAPTPACARVRAPVQMVKPLERNTRYVDAVMTVPKGVLYPM